MIITFIVILLLLLVFLLKLRISYSFSADNFNFKSDFSISIFFGKLVLLKPGKKPKKQTKEKEPSKKMDAGTLGKIKNDIVPIVYDLFCVFKKHCRFSRFETKVKLALEDPMNNGIAYGIVSGVFNTFYAYIYDYVKKPVLDISSDFNSGEGVIFTHSGEIIIRPLILAVKLGTNVKLLKKIKDTIQKIKTEVE